MFDAKRIGRTEGSVHFDFLTQPLLIIKQCAQIWDQVLMNRNSPLLTILWFGFTLHRRGSSNSPLFVVECQLERECLLSVKKSFILSPFCPIEKPQCSLK